MTWCPPTISLRWGEYFAPDADDDAKAADTAIKAHDAGLITLRSAVAKVKRPFNIDNVDQYLEALEEEREAKQAQLAADMHAMGGGDAESQEDGDEAEDDGAVMRSITGNVTKKAAPKKTPGGE